MKKNDFFAGMFLKKRISFIIIAVIAGLVLLLLPSGGTSSPDSTAQLSSTDEYTRKLEEKVAQLVLSLEGVKDCSVMITLDTAYSYLYASDQKLSTVSDSRDVEKKVVLRTEDGNEYPIIISETLPKVRGIAVVCRGGNTKTANDIKYMLSTLFLTVENGIFVTCTE